MNPRNLAIALVVAVGIASAQAQTKAVMPAFDAASVKPAPPGGGTGMRISGGPGTDDPGLISYSGVTLNRLLSTAYGVYRDQISGADWLDTERYVVTARVPEGTSKDQFDLMLQNLLAERFKLNLHHETRALQAYELTVVKGGPRLKKAAGTDAAAGAPPRPDIFGLAVDKNGCPVFPPGVHAAAGRLTANGAFCMTFVKFSLRDLAETLESRVRAANGESPFAPQAHIVDKTGLSGEFDFGLEFAIPRRSSTPVAGPTGGSGMEGPSLFTALEQQLGLELKPTKIPLDLIVVDHAEKVPTED